MKKILVLLSVVATIILAACNKPATDDVASKRQQLKEYKQQMHILEQQIDSLEEDLALVEDVEVVNVEVKELNSRPFEHFVEVTGGVEADLNVNVSPESVGVIDSILVSEGEWVSKGKILGKLNTSTLERSLEEVQIQLDLAKTNFERQKNLWDQNIGSEMQFLQSKTNMESMEKRLEGIQAQMRMSQIKSPVDGVVDVIYQKKGEIGSPQVPFAKVVNISDIKVYADVSESYLTKVKKGDRVNVFFPALNREVQARINQIGNTIDPNNRTFRIRIDMNNPDNMIKPNLVSVIKIRDYFSDEAIVIPSLYIKEDFKGSYTYVAENMEGNSVAKKVYVTTGVSNNNMTEIVEGLSEGMQIISEGYSQVADGTVIQYQ